MKISTSFAAVLAVCSLSSIASAQTVPTESEAYVSYSSQYIHPAFGEISEDGYFRAGVSHIFENGFFLQLEGTYHDQNDWQYSGEGSAITGGITTGCFGMQCTGVVTFYDRFDWDTSVYYMRVQVADTYSVAGGEFSWDFGLGEYANNWREPSTVYGDVAFDVPFGERWSAGVSVNMSEVTDRWDTERFTTYGVELQRRFNEFEAGLEFTSTTYNGNTSWMDGGNAVTFRIARPLTIS